MATFMVTNLNDSGAGSLRQAILDANLNAGLDTIMFTVAGMILLTSGPLPPITDPVHIFGPGAGALAVSGGNAFRIFTVALGASATIQGLTIRDGNTLLTGGGILNLGVLAINGAAFIGNHATVGGGALSTIGGSVTIDNTQFAGNAALAEGGAISSILSAVVIRNSRLTGNSALTLGGAVFASLGTVIIFNSTLAGNTALIAGGGISSAAELMQITHSALFQNTATLLGTALGGALLVAAGVTRMVNNTIAQNVAAVSGPAAAVIAGRLDISFVTMADNVVLLPIGAGLAAVVGVTRVKNSFIATTTDGSGNPRANCAGLLSTLFSAGGNMSTDATCPGFRQVTRAQLHLGPLQINPPGTTETMALLPGSVAIDAAIDSTDVEGNLVATDQRGVPRTPDVGAYEVVGLGAGGPGAGGGRSIPGAAPLFVSEGNCGGPTRRPFRPFTSR
ncbi:MAG: hypothetical protein JWN15_174 [Firmicutes bacterium]|nr:hypothetical protein [Bacillota bacterium]